MTSAAEPSSISTEAFPPGSLRFDRIAAALAAWPILGVYLDGWAHLNRGIVDTFLTPWHGLLYTGLLAVMGFLGFHHLRNMQQGHGWRYALPRGYALSLVGAVVFVAGGVVDFFWHSAFGFEVDVEALLSPPHLVLAAGATLMVTGPLRATSSRSRTGGRPTWSSHLPALLSLWLLLLILTFFTQYVHFTTDPGVFVGQRPHTTYYFDLLGTSSTLIFTTALMGVLLYALRGLMLLPGSMVLLIGGTTLLMVVMRYRANAGHLWPALAVIGAAVVADLIFLWLKPSAQRTPALRAFSFVVPWLIFTSYFATRGVTSGTWWTLPMWLGAPLQAGVVGLLLSYLAVPNAVSAPP